MNAPKASVSQQSKSHFEQAPIQTSFAYAELGISEIMPTLQLCRVGLVFPVYFSVLRIDYSA